MKGPQLSALTRVVLLMAAYFIAGIVGKAAVFLPGPMVLVWPPFGIALAAILLLGYGYWPGVAIGALLFSAANGTGIGWFAIGTALGNSVGAVACAYFLQRFGHFRNSLERVHDIAALAICAGFLGTTVNAAFNVAGLSLEGSVPMDNYFSSIVEWWVPNAMAVLVITPFLLAWKSGEKIYWNKSLGLEAAVCGVCLAAGTFLSFRSWYVYGIQTYPLAYLPYPFLVWGSLRFGQRGATTGTMLVSWLAISALLDGRGPFVMQSQRDSLMLIGSYIAVLAMTNLLLAAAATEREQAERAVRLSEKRYRGIVEDQTELIWRFKEDGTVTFINDAYCRFHGKSREELIGSKYLPMLSDEDRDIPLSYFCSLPAENPTISYDYKLVLPNDEVIWQQCTTRRLFNEKGETLEFQSVAQDVTRRKQIEEAVKEAEQRLRAILNAMVDGLLVTDAQGLLTAFNPAAERIFGRWAAEVLARPIKDLIAPEAHQDYDDYLERFVLKGETKIMETVGIRPDGLKVPIDLAISKVWLSGAPLLIAVVREISERKRLEEQFRQAQKMEAIGRLAGGIAHDFNNLIQAITGYASLLLSRPGLGLPEREMVEQIEKSGDRAAALTTQLLAFSRKQVLKPRFFSLNATVADMQSLLQRLIGANVQLVTRYNDPTNVVRADPGQIEQVILNLCINARDAMPQGGTLQICASSVDLPRKVEGVSHEFQPGPYVLLEISDSGSGMTPETKARLFEPFFTTKGIGKGTGLGLSIVYGIIKQSGGEIAVDSELGRGTTFRIYLPRFDGAIIETVQKAMPPSTAAGRETVLLVEDGEVVRSLLTQILKAHGYTVLDSSNGEEALRNALAFAGRIDLLVTDLVMPKMSGRALAEKLSGKHQGMRVLYISGYTDDEVIRYGRLDAGSDFLQKPFRPEALLNRVRQILDTHE